MSLGERLAIFICAQKTSKIDGVNSRRSGRDSGVEGTVSTE